MCVDERVDRHRSGRLHGGQSKAEALQWNAAHLAEYRHTSRITAKRSNVILNPIEGQPLIIEPGVHLINLNLGGVGPAKD